VKVLDLGAAQAIAYGHIPSLFVCKCLRIGWVTHECAGNRLELLLSVHQGLLHVLFYHPAALAGRNHRIEALAAALAVLGERPVTLGRELTKQFEEIATVAAQDVVAWIAANPQRTRGEFALVIHAQAQEASSTGDHDQMLQLLMQELPLKTAVKLAAELTGESKNNLYERALVLKEATKS